MRIAWFSNAPWCPSGYGQQTRLVLERLAQAGHQILCIDSCGALSYGAIDYNGLFPVIPRPVSDRHMLAVLEDNEIDVLFSFVDSWAIDGSGSRAAWVPWMPIDRDPPNPTALTLAAKAAKPLTCSQYGLDQLLERNIPAEYVPCAYDPMVFHERDRSECRELMGMEDAFWFGIVADNRTRPSRKNLQQQIQAFARLASERDDVMLYLHTCMSTARGGEDLEGLIRHLKVESRVAWIDQDLIVSTGAPLECLATTYGAMDCLLGVSAEEGFGIPLIEAQACGVPVIAGDWTAMSELVMSGWTVSKHDADTVWSCGGMRYLPRVEAITEAMRTAYREARDHRGAAVHDIANGYAVDHVVNQYWLPLLEELAATERS